MEIAGWESLCLEKCAAADPSKGARQAQARPKLQAVEELRKNRKQAQNTQNFYLSFLN
jgi:hypothetical protein